MAKKKKTTKKKAKPSRGRPSKFDDDMIRQAEILAVKGFTDKEIAELFDVTEQTINNWKKDYPQFFVSLKKGKEIRDAAVERSLFERACGYSHPEVHITNYQGTVTKTEVIKHYPPDPTSMIFWLKNRQPDKWRDKQDLNIGGQKDNPVPIFVINRPSKVK